MQLDNNGRELMSKFDKKGSQAARAAWLYYLEELTQGQVARKLGVSRSTVIRLLRRAKEEGLVHISLDVSHEAFKTERDLECCYGLERVRLVPESDDEATQKHWLGHAAAELIMQMVADDSVIAVSWGTTLQAMADSLIGVNAISGAEFVALIGGLHNATRGTNPYEVAKQLGQYFNVPARALHAPVFVQDEATAHGLANDPGVQDTLALAHQASLVVYSVGAIHDETTMFKLGYVNSKEKEFLRNHGAVGEIACRWIDLDGNPVELPPSINPIGISLDKLREIPRRLAVAGGRLKRDVVLGSLRGGFVTTLVTDENTAAYLLDNA
jgi:DNA-binding transcriptional regulator LsrR (DeoR family)